MESVTPNGHYLPDELPKRSSTVNYGTKTFDPKCVDLAARFIDDCENITNSQKVEHTTNLAGLIQQAIEDYIEEKNLDFP